ncbi:hypothetical protein [Mycobacteroides franklinii]|uniref:hypothetical protein n=1 Tax=Mycobacteroides franklinii TaxID=948102 RepID=UPI0013E8C0F9
MAIQMRRRPQLMLVAMLIGAIAALPLLLHCVPGDTRQDAPAAHHQVNSATTQQGAVRPMSTGIAAGHPHAGSAVHGALCQSLDGLTAALRADNPLRLLAAFAATMVAAVLMAPLLASFSRGPPVRARAVVSRSGRVLLTDLCIIRR